MKRQIQMTCIAVYEQRPIALTPEGVGKEVRTWMTHRTSERRLVPTGQLLVTYEEPLIQSGRASKRRQNSRRAHLTFVAGMNGSRRSTVEQALLDLHSHLSDHWKQIGPPVLSAI